MQLVVVRIVYGTICFALLAGIVPRLVGTIWLCPAPAIFCREKEGKRGLQALGLRSCLVGLEDYCGQTIKRCCCVFLQDRPNLAFCRRTYMSCTALRETVGG